MILQWGRNMRVAESSSVAGNIHSTRCFLQWGRNMRVAESTAATACRFIALYLQWGRNMRVAERLHQSPRFI